MNFTRKTLTLILFSACFALTAPANDATVTDISVRQRWPWSRLVDIDYVLNGDAALRMDVVVSASDGSVPLTLPITSLSGDLYSVSPGQRRIVWDPTRSAYTNNILTRFNVALTPTVTPLYMVIDLTKTAGAADQIEHIYEADLDSGAYGTVATNPVNGISSIAWTGVTNNPIYRDTHLVLRRVRAGSVVTETSSTITVERDYYIAVFETTQNQWRQITGSYPSCKFSTNRDGPVERSASYNALRGNTGEGIDWPSTGGQVGSNSFIAKVRTKTGVDNVDLPDNAQWEYACRAGTSTLYHDNDHTATTVANNLRALACFGKGEPGPPASVGSFLPNAWGIYDMHGNVQEWTLDIYSGADRTRRGGSFFYESGRCTSSFANASVAGDTDVYGFNGFRLVINLD